MSFPGCFLAVIQQLSLQSPQFAIVPVLTGVAEGQSLQALVCFSLPLVHGPVLVLNQHQLMPRPICTVSPGVSPGQGCLPAWPAASAPSSPLQTPPSHVLQLPGLPPSLQPNPGAPWHSGFFAICNCKSIEMKQRTSAYSENLSCLLL